MAPDHHAEKERDHPIEKLSPRRAFSFRESGRITSNRSQSLKGRGVALLLTGLTGDSELIALENHQAETCQISWGHRAEQNPILSKLTIPAR
jgi:hypothetical protein